VVVLLAAGAWLVFRGPGDDSPGTVASSPPRTNTVGAIYPQLGANSEESKDILSGETFATEYVNSRHDLKLPAPALPGGDGLLGATLKLVSIDSVDRCQAGATFRQLVDREGAVAVLGAYESTLTLRSILAADEREVPLVSDTASAPSLTERPRKPQLDGCGESRTDPRPSRWFFRVGPSDREAAEQFLELVARHKPRDRKPRVAILHESNDIFGNNAARVTEALAQQRGMEARQFKYHTVIGSHGESPCKPLKALIPEIAGYHPDAVIAASYPPDAIAAVQTMKDRNYSPPALLTFGAGFLTDSFISEVENSHPRCSGLPTADPAGIVARTPWSRRIALSNPAVRPVVKAYEDRFGERMNPRSAAGFTAMLLVAQAIHKAGSTRPFEIRDALHDLKLPAAATIMPWDGVRFDASGQNTRAHFVLQQIIDGGYVDVYPKARASRGLIWPLAAARK
jgi:branched-chain amino acid transport system substrate-binding protein